MKRYLTVMCAVHAIVNMAIQPHALAQRAETDTDHAAQNGTYRGAKTDTEPLKAKNTDQPSPREEADELLRKGKSAYHLGDYKEAAYFFSEAYRLTLDKGYLFNIAQAYRLSGDCEKALAVYHHFLRLAPEHPNAPQAILHRETLTKQCKSSSASLPPSQERFREKAHARASTPNPELDRDPSGKQSPRAATQGDRAIERQARIATSAPDCHAKGPARAADASRGWGYAALSVGTIMAVSATYLFVRNEARKDDHAFRSARLGYELSASESRASLKEELDADGARIARTDHWVLGLSAGAALALGTGLGILIESALFGAPGANSTASSISISPRHVSVALRF